MKLLGFILTYSLVWLIHLLPGNILYLLSDFLSMLNYRVFSYRKKIVLDNLGKAFPDLEEKDIKRVVKKFYHHLTDLMLESVLFTFDTRKKALKKVTFKNLELLELLYSEGKMVMAVTAHYGNWEYLSTLPLVTEYPVIAIYKPLHNKYFDRWIIRNRTRFGVEVTPMEHIARKLMAYHRDGKPALTLFLSDQSPSFRQIQYWTEFLGQKTPMYLGTEKLARKLDAAVVFLKIRKIKRGRYEIDPVLICKDPGSMVPHAITDQHARVLEELIREKPEYWLWSHRRWKHTYEKYLERKAGRQ